MDEILLEPLDDLGIEKKFKCGNGSIENMISESYYMSILNQSYAGKIVFNNVTIGYFMYSFKSIPVKRFVEAEFIADYCPKTSFIPAFFIDYIAINSNVQKKKLGTVVLKLIIKMAKEISKTYPIRVIVLDALGEYYDWYEKNGFRPLDVESITTTSRSPTILMYMDCFSKEDFEKIEEYNLV